MSFSESSFSEENEKIYEKIIFDGFHKKTKQLKQENNKRYVY